MIRWIMEETRGERFIDNILVELCERLRANEIPVARATLHFTTQHPEWLGARIVWRKGMSRAEIITFGYGVEATASYRNSPVNAIKSGAQFVRQKLRANATFDHPFYAQLRESGYTDYVALPLPHTQDKTHVVSFAADREGGFTRRELTFLEALLPALSLVTEIRLKNRIMRTLLNTYVGPHASGQILAGATTRGSGVTVNAAILICDLRDFTVISDRWPRDDVIALLNTYFDAICGPIEKHGGEILKFIGDGLLAIFPLSNPDACRDLLEAIAEARAAMDVVNEGMVIKGKQPLRYGIGVHVGDVMYGNIGSRTRLDFTVIGPAVNVASRLEDLTKVLHRPVLFSKEFVELASCGSSVENLGSYILRGLEDPIEVFAQSGSHPAEGSAARNTES